MNDYLEILRNEFEAGPNSFLIKLRPDLVWDTAAFTRLTDAMRICCEQQSGSRDLERWMARGFWYVPGFVKEWTSHPNFPKTEPTKYYDDAYRLLDELAFWFFSGESPCLRDTPVISN